MYELMSIDLNTGRESVLVICNISQLDELEDIIRTAKIGQVDVNKREDVLISLIENTPELDAHVPAITYVYINE